MRTELERFLSAHGGSFEGKRVLDYGCGAMPYHYLFEQAGVRDYVGADLERSGGEPPVRLGPRGEIPQSAGLFDAVLSFQVLEHVEDPAFYLSECRRVLKDGGRLLLSTHGFWKYHPEPVDFWRWTSEGLRKTVTAAGFEAVSFRGVFGLPAIGMQLWQEGVSGAIPPALRPAFFFLLQGMIGFQDRLTPQASKDRDAGTYFLTAVKK